MRARIVVAALCCLMLTGQALAGDSGPGFLIVGPGRFAEALRPLVKARAREMPTRFVALERVLRRERGQDDAERVKRFLYGQHRRGTVRYVLLVGDADVFPVRYMVLDRVTPAAFDYAFYPSDLYYADVAKRDGSFEDWNLCRLGFHAEYWGEVRGEKNKRDPINLDAVDYLPELAVGRWPVGTPAEASLLVEKTLAREQAGRTRKERAAATLVAVDGWVDARPLLRRAAESLGAAWAVTSLLYGEGASAAPSPERLVAQLNSGADLVIHTGHGTDDSWAGCLGPGELGRITNGARLPVLYSAGCSTARFAALPPYEPYRDTAGLVHEGTDHGEVFRGPPPPPSCYQAGRFNPPGLGEVLVRGGVHGAVAYIGCNTGSQPCGLTLVEGFVDALRQEPAMRLGDAWAAAVVFYHRHERLSELVPDEGWYPPSIFFQAMKFMVFGDPTLRVNPGLTP